MQSGESVLLHRFGWRAMSRKRSELQRGFAQVQWQCKLSKFSNLLRDHQRPLGHSSLRCNLRGHDFSPSVRSDRRVQERKAVRTAATLAPAEPKDLRRSKRRTPRQRSARRRLWRLGQPTLLRTKGDGAKAQGLRCLKLMSIMRVYFSEVVTNCRREMQAVCGA
jgi:hypothetical protein